MIFSEHFLIFLSMGIFLSLVSCQCAKLQFVLFIHDIRVLSPVYTTLDFWYRTTFLVLGLSKYIR